MAGTDAATRDIERADRVDKAQEQDLNIPRASTLTRAGSNLGLQRACTLPTEDKELRHAATMPITHDIDSIRPFCCGLWKTQQFLGALLGTGSLLAVVLISPIGLNGASNRMLGLTLMCGWFWVFEVLPIHVTSLLPLVLMPFLRITSSAIAAKAYWDPVQMLVVGTYFVDIALEEVHLPRRVALRLLLATGVVQPWLLLLVFMSACFLLSMVCNNIAVTLMITPFAIGLMNAAEVRAADAAAHDVPGEEPSASESIDFPVQAHATVAEVQRFSLGLLLGIAYSTTAGGMATLIGCIPNELLLGQGTLSTQVNFAAFIKYAFPTALVAFVMAYLSVYFRYVRGMSLQVVTQDELESEHEELKNEIGPFSRDELIVTIVQVVQFTLLFCGPWIAEISIFETPYGETLMGDSTLACLPAIALFACPSVVRPGQSILTWSAVHEKFDFGLLLLIGGGFAIALGFVESGLNVALGDWLAGAIQEMSPFTVTVVIVLVCTLATQFFSAVGTATTMMPTLISTASRAVRHPLGLVLPATIACSFAFALPTAMPANVIVLAKSQDLGMPLRVRDFFLTGLPLNLAMVLIGSILLHFMGQAVFDTGSPFPLWACDGVGCIWSNVEGVINGVPVSSQACIMDITSNMATCQLANRTWVDVDTVNTHLVR